MACSQCDVLEAQVSLVTEIVHRCHVADEDDVLDADTKPAVGVKPRLVRDSHTGLQRRVVQSCGISQRLVVMGVEEGLHTYPHTNTVRALMDI